MRQTISTLMLLFFLANQMALAQKNDYLWPLGLGPAISAYNFFLDFGGPDTPRVVLRSDTMATGYSAAFCDASGKILLYSNGRWMLNGQGAFVENSLDLNPTLPDWQVADYPGYQSGFFLEKPGDPNIVFFISLDYGLHPAQKWPYYFVGQNLMVATIDLAANNGAAKVLEKNNILLTGTLMAPTACRHANGLDWWIMVSDADENRHYRLLLSAQGFSAPQTQFIGTKPNPIPFDGSNKRCQIVGNCFSPHGKYYADINDVLGFSIFAFDRCSGLLSDERRVEYPAPLPNYPTWHRNWIGTGAVFSPNDSLFYKTTTFDPSAQPWSNAGKIPYLLQYDLSQPDLAAVVDTINSSDWSFPAHLSEEHFYGAELAPDGRIYVVHEGVSYCTVQYPNVRGKGSKFVHNKPACGVIIGSAIPYMPNYRLGPLDGSPCDTLGLDNIPVAHFRLDDTLDALSRYCYDLSYHEPETWHWDFGDGSSSTSPSPLHQYTSPGVYAVCLTVSNAHGSNTACRTLYVGVSRTASPTIRGRVDVSPNPFQNRLQVRLDAGQHHPVFRLYDQMGRLRREGLLTMDVTEFNTTGLAAGWYFWEVVGAVGVIGQGRAVLARG